MSASTISELGKVPTVRRGRPSDYSDAEDSIILRYTSTEECNEQLMAAGFKARTPSALASRRDLLRKKMVNDVDLDAIRGTDDELPLLATIRRNLSHQLDDFANQCEQEFKELQVKHEQLREAIEADIAAVTARIHELIDD